MNETIVPEAAILAAHYLSQLTVNQPIPVAARSKACGLSLAGIEGSNAAGGTDVSLL